MLSTKHIRGIYNPHAQHMEVQSCYSQPLTLLLFVIEMMQTPTMNNVSIEEHVRGVVKDLLRTRSATKTHGLVPDLRGSHRVPWKGLQNQLSIQVILITFFIIIITFIAIAIHHHHIYFMKLQIGHFAL